MLLAARPTTARTWAGFAPFLAVGAFFVLTRITLLLLTVREHEFVLPSVTNDVKYIYIQWYAILADGRFPQDDVMWQYPPAAALVMLAPALLPLSYAISFYWISFAFDVLAFVVLLRAGRSQARTSPSGQRPWFDRRTQPWAAWVWAIGVALGGPIAYGRYDLIVTAVAVCGLALVAGHRPRDGRESSRFGAGGALIAFGALLKVWPALLLLVLGPWRKAGRAWAAAAATAAPVVFAFWVTMPNAMSFLSAQGGRGIEIESIGALPFHIAIHHGWPGQVGLNYGSMEFLGPWVQLVAALSLVASVLAMCWLLYWRLTVRVWRNATAADAALVAVLLFVVTSRVISPQYMVWLVGLSAVCALHWRPGRAAPDVRREDSVMLLPILLILLATALSCAEFPYWFNELLRCERGAVLLVTVRNMLLVSAAFIGAARLWRSTRAPGPESPGAELHLPGQRMAVSVDETEPA